jgi:8-oxo-dGTP pyrophosphatase MutT (NUDIX family)
VAAKPRDAATLVLMRDAGATEVLLLKRHPQSAFLPEAHVFPGGVVEPADYAAEVERLCQGLDFEQAHRIIRDVSPPERSLGFFVSAIREAFEEAGILLAYVERSRRFPDEEQLARLSKHRTEVHVKPSVLGSVVRNEGLNLATDRLFYFGHWITPEVLPIRFDARFFVAVCPPGQEARYDGKETVEARWISPRDALSEYKMGMLRLAPPTLSTLSELAGFQRTDEVIDYAKKKDMRVDFG